MSAFRQGADMVSVVINVCKVPISDMASDPLPLTLAKTAARQMVVSGLHDYRVTDFGAPDLNNLAVQCNELDVIKREREE